MAPPFPLPVPPEDPLADLHPTGRSGGKPQPPAPSRARSGERSSDLARECQTLRRRKDGEVPGVRYRTLALLRSAEEFVQSQYMEKGLN